MKITREWLAETDHCPDGRSFGETMIPPGGVEIADCWPLIDRPDFVVSLAVKSEAIAYHEARFVVERVLRHHVAARSETGDDCDVGDQETWDALGNVRDCARPALPVLRADIAALAYFAIAVKKDLPLGHRLNACAQLAAADYQARLNKGLALSLVQGAAYSIGSSMGMKAAAKAIIGYVVLIVERRRDV